MRGAVHNETNLREVAPDCLDFAAKLRRALAPTWPRLAAEGISTNDVERAGVEDYRRVFGHRISARHWRRIFRMVRERGAQGIEGDSLALYLPRRIRRIAADPRPESGGDAALDGLRQGISALASPQSLAMQDRAWLWDRTFREFELGIAAGEDERSLRRRFVNCLNVQAPGIGAGPDAILRAWQRNYRIWTGSGRLLESLTDGRSEREQSRPIPKSDLDAIARTAVFETGGRLAQAWRLVRQRGEISTETENRFATAPARSDYVPAAIRDEIGPSLPALSRYLRGPRAGKLGGAFIERDWSGVAAGDWYQADDVTLPVYYAVSDGGWWRLTRGQCLVMIDLRSRRILDYVLIDEKSYDGLRIRRLMNRVCDRPGLPRRGFYFEGGIWKKARVVTGGKRQNACGTVEIETGFRSLGLDFVHAGTPGAKPIERVIGMTQDMMEWVPGYCGRNEMTDRFERIHRAKLDVEARRRTPLEAGFLSADEWFGALSSIFERYNKSRQDRSRSTGGLSPNDAWKQFNREDDPLVRIPPEARHLLATHRTEVKVGRNGVTVRLGDTFTYRSEETGRRYGERVIAWFDPESPDFCTITDLDKRHPVVVPRAVTAPAMGATRAEMSAAKASVAAHEGVIRERYSELRSEYMPPTRRAVVSLGTARLGAAMGAQRAAAEEEQKQRSRTSKDLVRRISNVMPVTRSRALAEDMASDPVRAEAAARLAEILRGDTP